jgi:mannose-6-phosphate isomerase-like protein (cupin superfamily)
MTTAHEIQPGRRIDLAREVIGLDRSDRRARLVEQKKGRPPQRIDGFTIGAPRITGDAPHDGEVHPDGDEVLYLVSGAVAVTLELADGDCLVDLGAGDAVVVPKGVSHRITMREPGQLIHITPGPNGEARPLAAPHADSDRRSADHVRGIRRSGPLAASVLDKEDRCE